MNIKGVIGRFGLVIMLNMIVTILSVEFVPEGVWIVNLLFVLGGFLYVRFGGDK